MYLHLFISSKKHNVFGYTGRFLGQIPRLSHTSQNFKRRKLFDQKIKIWRQNWGILKLRRLCCQVGVISFIWPQEHVASCCYERSLLEGYIAKRNPFCESNRSRIDACALFCLNVLSIKVGFSYMSHPKGCNFSSIFFRLLLPLPYSINFSQCFDVAGTQRVRWIKFDGSDQTRGISSAFIEPHFFHPQEHPLSPTCRFIVEVEECHFCSENIGRWTAVITAPLNHLTLAVMGLQEGE